MLLSSLGSTLPRHIPGSALSVALQHAFYSALLDYSMLAPLYDAFYSTTTHPSLNLDAFVCSHLLHCTRSTISGSRLEIIPGNPFLARRKLQDRIGRVSTWKGVVAEQRGRVQGARRTAPLDQEGQQQLSLLPLPSSLGRSHSTTDQQQLTLLGFPLAFGLPTLPLPSRPSA